MNDFERRRAWFRFVAVAGALCTVGMAVAIVTGSLLGVVFVLVFSAAVGGALFASVMTGRGGARRPDDPLR